ncbi:hypothetical protein NDU88_005408 [Pleurodeles waltl]|uniref:Uncharacterized protein n=1 Tax=Pleurodeles waltl TaxID=8319 RepID=A0AAV7RKX3_PLEWA|nr:hypothetical protein NDU88_005408 [Pleurodeles waltl]
MVKRDPPGPAVNHQQRPPAFSTTDEPQQDTPTSAVALLLTDPKMEAGGTGSDHRAILPAAGPHSQASRASPAPPPGYPRPTPRVGPKLQPSCRQMTTKPSAGAGWRGGSPSVHPRTHKSTGQTAAAPVPVIHIPPPAPRCLRTGSQSPHHRLIRACHQRRSGRSGTLHHLQSSRCPPQGARGSRETPCQHPAAHRSSHHLALAPVIDPKMAAATSKICHSGTRRGVSINNLRATPARRSSVQMPHRQL